MMNTTLTAANGYYCYNVATIVTFTEEVWAED